MGYIQDNLCIEKYLRYLDATLNQVFMLGIDAIDLYIKKKPTLLQQYGNNGEKLVIIVTTNGALH